MDPRFSGVDPLAGREATRPAIGHAIDPPVVQERSEPDSPRVWTSLMAGAAGPVGGAILATMLFFIAFAIFGGGGGLKGTASGAALKAFRSNPIGMLAAAVGLQVGMGLFACIGGWLSGIPWRRRLSLVRPPIGARVYVALAVASVGTTLAGLLIAELLMRASLLPEIGASRTQHVEQFLAAPAVWVVPLILSMSVLPGINEELLYRGFMQTGLLARWRPWLAIGVTTVLFAIAHGDLSYAVFTVPDGLWLGYMAWRTGSVFPGMVCHAVTNGAFQTVGWLTADASEMHAQQHLSPWEFAGFAGIVVVIGLPAVWYSVRVLERVARGAAWAKTLAEDPAPPLTTPC